MRIRDECSCVVESSGSGRRDETRMGMQMRMRAGMGTGRRVRTGGCEKNTPHGGTADIRDRPALSPCERYMRQQSEHTSLLSSFVGFGRGSSGNSCEYNFCFCCSCFFRLSTFCS